MKCLMGIDIGGTMVKAALFDLTGREIAAKGRKLTILYPGKDMNERSIEEAEKMTYEVIRSVVADAKISADDILGIGVTGQANGAYMFDADGKPVHDAVMSGDARAKGYVKKWYADGTHDKLLPKIRQSIWPGNVPAIIAWFKDNDPQTLARAKTIVTAKDFVRYLLTGEFCLEITEATGIASMDQTTETFTEEIFKAYGIEEYMNRYPARVADCTEITGRVTGRAASLTGLAAGTPVVGGQMDTGASIYSVGVTDDSKMGIIVGSWGINAYVTKVPLVSKDIFMAYRYCIPDTYEIMEGSPTSTTNLEWMIENYMNRASESHIYQKCDSLVESAPFRDTVIFLPFLYGTNVNIDSKAAFVGLKGNHGLSHMLRAIYEGVVFCHMYHIERLLKFTSMPEVVRMAGGATRSGTWMRVFADVLGVRVEVPEAEELGAMGVAMLAGVGVGAFASVEDAIAICTKIKAHYEPDPAKHEYYAEKYKTYKTLIDTLDPLWGRIDALS
ncbi:MAG: carbohydrate kinase [Synergistaceae bacterium]|nr:carbohydrate kinase [Synergistaceae bacterium]